MTKHPMANFQIAKLLPDFVILVDLGPWDEYPTITNSAEEVVEYLYRHHKPLVAGRRIIYIDSEGQRAELLVKDGRFAGFGFLAQQSPVKGSP